MESSNSVNLIDTNKNLEEKICRVIDSEGIVGCVEDSEGIININRNLSTKSADIIGIMFPDYLYNPADVTDEELALMFDEIRVYIFNNDLKVFIDYIKLETLNKFMNFMGQSSISFIGYCYEINKNVIEIIERLASEDSRIRIRKLYVTSYDIDVVQQIELLKPLDLLCTRNQMRRAVRFKKVHDNLNLVAKISSIEFKSLKVKVRFYSENYDIKLFQNIFNGSDSTIKFGLIINININDVKKNKCTLTFPRLNNVDSLTFCRNDTKYSNPIKFDIQYPLRNLVFYRYCKAIELHYETIKCLKLLSCGTKNFKLQRYEPVSKGIVTESTIDFLIIKNTVSDQIHNIIFNTNLSVYSVFIQNTIINEKTYKEIFERKHNIVLNTFSRDINEKNEQNVINVKKIPTEEIVNLNMIRHLRSITLKNYPTPVFLNTLFLFPKDVILFRYVNNYEYMVYEGSLTPNILNSYTIYNNKLQSAFYVNNSHYQLFRSVVFLGISDLNDYSELDKLDVTGHSYLNKCDPYANNILAAVSSHNVYTFMFNRNNLAEKIVKNKTNAINNAKDKLRIKCKGKQH